MTTMELSLNFKEKLNEGLKTCWKSSANIALIKYWGKKGHQLPANPSISFTLNEAYTITKIVANLHEAGDGPMVSFTFEGEKNPAFAQKIEDFLKELVPQLPYLQYASLYIESGNNFPHSAGIASSASSMSALAIAVVCLEQQLLMQKADQDTILKKASYIARLGSGSACRSIYGGYSIWGEHPDFENSSDEFAIRWNYPCGDLFRNIKDTILIVDQSQKKVSSRVGHSLMKDHPFAQARYEQAMQNMTKIKTAIMNNDWDSFALIVENEAMTLHAMMMTSTPGYMLMHPNTIKIVELISEIRKQKDMKICYTLDAGPNIHLLYPEEEAVRVSSFIESLKPYCHDGKMIFDSIGKGPENLQCK